MSIDDTAIEPGGFSQNSTGKVRLMNTRTKTTPLPTHQITLLRASNRTGRISGRSAARSLTVAVLLDALRFRRPPVQRDLGHPCVCVTCHFALAFR